MTDWTDLSDWLVGVTALLGTLVGAGDTDVECLRLGALDAVRVRAFTTERPELLGEVYVDDAAAQTDRELLRDYAERDLRLRGGALERLECRVMSRGDRRLVIDVVDRLGRTWVDDDAGRRRELPRAAAAHRSVTLTQESDGWRVAAVR